MVEQVRAKFKVESTTVYDDSQEDFSVAVHLQVVTNETEDPSGENKSFSRWTPTGSLHMHVTNPALAGFFVEGQLYYLDIIPANASFGVAP